VLPFTECCEELGYSPAPARHTLLAIANGKPYTGRVRWCAGGACGGNGSPIGAKGAAVAPKPAHEILMNGGSVCPFRARQCRFVVFGFLGA